MSCSGNGVSDLDLGPVGHAGPEDELASSGELVDPLLGAEAAADVGQAGGLGRFLRGPLGRLVLPGRPVGPPAVLAAAVGSTLVTASEVAGAVPVHTFTVSTDRPRPVDSVERVAFLQMTSEEWDRLGEELGDFLARRDRLNVVDHLDVLGSSGNVVLLEAKGRRAGGHPTRLALLVDRDELERATRSA